MARLEEEAGAYALPKNGPDRINRLHKIYQKNHLGAFFLSSSAPSIYLADNRIERDTCPQKWDLGSRLLAYNKRALCIALAFAL